MRLTSRSSRASCPRFGEQVSLLCGTVDGARYIRGEAEGKPHFEALASLSPLPQKEEA